MRSTPARMRSSSSECNKATLKTTSDSGPLVLRAIEERSKAAKTRPGFQMINVLFVLPDLRGGGAERVVLNVLRRLDSSRFSVTLFLIRRRGVLWNEAPSNVRLICATEDRSALYAIPIALLKLLQESRSQDILVAGLELGPTYLVYLAGLLRRKPTLGWIHTSFGPNLYQSYLTLINRVLSRLVLKRFSRVVFVSNGGKQAMRKWLGVDNDCEGNWTVIPNPFELPFCKGNRATASASQNPSPVVIGAGRLEAAKGFDILIRAHALLLREGVRHRVVIFGEGKDRAQLEKLASELGVEKSVVMPGYVSNIIESMKGAAAFVLCSRYEGFGMVILEAMAAGLPVIAADCPSGPSEVLEGGKYGILIPPEDPASLADALRRILSDTNLSDKLIEAGAARIRDFSPDRIIPRWERLLSELGA